MPTLTLARLLPCVALWGEGGMWARLAKAICHKLNDLAGPISIDWGAYQLTGA
jgi:hypothetical protein